VDAPNRTLTVKDLASGNPVVVRTNPDSSLHRLPPFVAQMIATFNSSGAPGSGMPGRPAAGSPGSGPAAGGMSGRPPNGGPGGAPGNGPADFQQMIERAPPLALSELKPGDALIVLSTEGATTSEVTAITVLSGVEPILAARPKGSTDVVLGPWNMGMGESGP